MALGDTWISRRTGTELFRGVARNDSLKRWAVCGGPGTGFPQVIFTAEDVALSTWASRTAPNTDSLNDAKSDNAVQNIICGDNGRILHSADMISWSSLAVGGARQMQRLDFGPTSLPGNLFIASGINVITRQSTPSVPTGWSQIDTSVTTLFGIAHDGASRWVAVGGSVGVGQVAFSTGGLAGWFASQHTVATANQFRGVAFGAGLFVAVGDGGHIWTSPTGAGGTFTQRTSTTANNLRSVAFAGGVFIAVGDGGTIVASVDGIAWASKTSGVGDQLMDVSYDAVTNVVIAAGFNGRILSSIEPLEPEVSAQDPAPSAVEQDRGKDISYRVGGNDGVSGLNTILDIDSAGSINAITAGILQFPFDGPASVITPFIDGGISGFDVVIDYRGQYPPGSSVDVTIEAESTSAIPMAPVNYAFGVGAHPVLPGTLLQIAR